ncbi:MAG: RloB family protein [Pseudomonadota bacterium]|nr:RloB family protein [Pseudomonadota bacterium]
MTRRRRNRNFRRKQGTSPELDVIWVYAEGEKTEPLYVNGLKRDLGLGNISVRKVGSRTAPSSLLEKAKREISRAGQNGPDKVYLLFDRDQFDCFQPAIEECRTDRIITAIPSDPCFEYWLLLHVTRTTRAFENANQVITELKRYPPFTGYFKAKDGVYDEIKHLTDVAMENAAACRLQIQAADASRPHTKVDKLITSLIEQRNRIQSARK